MNNDKDKKAQPQPQTAENPTGNPFDNNQPVDQDVQSAQEELEKEQQFKEAQTERD